MTAGSAGVANAVTRTVAPAGAASNNHPRKAVDPVLSTVDVGAGA